MTNDKEFKFWTPEGTEIGISEITVSVHETVDDIKVENFLVYDQYGKLIDKAILSYNDIHQVVLFIEDLDLMKEFGDALPAGNPDSQYDAMKEEYGV